MEEFAKMIYKKWFEEEAGNLSWGDYDKAVAKIHEILKEELAEEIECSINKTVWDIQEKAFIAGFSYACNECLSNGKIEF